MTGTGADFKIYDDQVQGGMVETLVQNTDAFNAASRGAIRLVTNRLPGNFEIEAFFQNIDGLVQRRDLTSVAPVAAQKVTQEEMISVKLNRRVGPIEQTLDAFRKIGAQAGEQSLSFLIGTQIAKAMQVDWLHSGLLSVVNALVNIPALGHSAAASLGTSDLVNGLSKMGDASSRVILWLMHSKPYYDLVNNQIADNIDGVSNFNVATATPITLNRPVLVTDDDALILPGSPNRYRTLGLVASAVTLEDSEEDMIQNEIVTGLENLVVRLQTEFAYNVGLKGFQWDTTNGGVNPTNAALGTGSNWDQIMANVKDLAGVFVESD